MNSDDDDDDVGFGTGQRRVQIGAAATLDDDDVLQQMIAEFEEEQEELFEAQRPRPPRDHSDFSEHEAVARGGRAAAAAASDDSDDGDDGLAVAVVADGVAAAADDDAVGYDESSSSSSSSSSGDGDEMMVAQPKAHRRQKRRRAVAVVAEDSDSGDDGPRLPPPKLRGKVRFQRDATADDDSDDAGAESDAVDVDADKEVAPPAGGGGDDDADDDESLDQTFARIVQTYMRSGRGPGEILRDEFNFDVMLSEQAATEGARTNRPGCATLVEVHTRLDEVSGEMFENEMALHNRHVKRDKPSDIYYNTNKVHDAEIAETYNQLRHELDAIMHMARRAFMLRRIASGHAVPLTTDDMLRTYRSDATKKNINLRAITFFLEQAHTRRLRKQRPEAGKSGGGGDIFLYEPLIIDGHMTVSFRRVGTLESWMSDLVRPDKYPDLFNSLISKASTLPHARKFLETTEDVRFPFYEVSDYIHGFENCYVNTFECRAYFYDNVDDKLDTSKLVARHHHEGVRLEPEWFDMRKRRRACVIDYDAREWTYVKQHLDGTKETIRYPFAATLVGRDIAASKAAGTYVVEEEEADGDPMLFVEPPPIHLQMPAMQQLLDFQEYDGEMQMWFYAMLGRALLPVGTRDQFDCIMLMSGQTQSGKSTVLNAFSDSLLPNKERIAILSSNKEDKFGLQTSYNKDVLICDEMERKPSWNQGEIKSMASGTWMSIAIKNSDPVFLRWRAPVIISSNYKVPEWGSGGSDVYALVRRFAPFPFPHTVARPDPRMATALKGPERGLFFVSCMLSYDWLIRNVGKTAFNKIAPPRLLLALNEMLCELHPLVHFLESSGLVEAADEDASDDDRRSVYMPLESLKVMYEEWLKQSHIKTDNKWLPDFYRPPLLAMQCVIGQDKEALPYPRKAAGAAADDFDRPPRQIFVYGIDVAV